MADTAVVAASDDAAVPQNVGDVALQNGGDVAVQNGGGEGNGEPPQPPPQRESFFAICQSLMIRAVIIYFISSMFRRPSQTPAAGGGTAPAAKLAANLFENGTYMDLYVYLSELETGGDFSQLAWKQTGLQYGDWKSGPTADGIYTHEYRFRPSKQLQSNGSIFMHVYLVRAGRHPDPGAGELHSAEQTVLRYKRLNRFKRRVYRRTHNLLTGSSATSEEDLHKADTIRHEILSHWHPNITVSVVHDFTAWSKSTLVQPLDQYIEFLPSEDRYKPILYVNDYWNFNKDYMPINETVEELTLTLTFQPISMMKFQMYSSMNIRNKWMSNLMGEQTGEEDENDQDTLKEALLTTNIYLMAMTVAVSLLHSVFEFLAFKNDIQFWKNRESLEGLSVRSVVFGVFQSVVVLLYVLDNETNTMIRISCFVGLLIEIWKIGRVTDVTIDWRARVGGFLPRISIQDKGSYVHSNTREYDRMAFRYVSWLVYPLLVGYAVYSLMYAEHTGWYSFTLSILYGFLLMFGFIMMTPQLFINYKLKSVAHLPWRMLTYKALNTFIDDIFAFVIRMPMMYRIGCLRDDVVFFVYLYQRYIYRVDPSRVNEFGYSQEMFDKKPADEGVQNEALKDCPETTTSPTETANGVLNGSAPVENPAEEKSSQSKKED